jgi:hypothetical protein
MNYTNMYSVSESFKTLCFVSSHSKGQEKKEANGLPVFYE